MEADNANLMHDKVSSSHESQISLTEAQLAVKKYFSRTYTIMYVNICMATVGTLLVGINASVYSVKH